MVSTYVHVLEFHVLFIWAFIACAFSMNFQCCLEWQLIFWAVFPIPSLPLSIVYSVWWVPFSLSWVGAHGWIARICQPWEKSPSRSWLPVVIAPGCLRHPTSTWWCSWLQHAPQSFSNWWSQLYIVGLPNMNLINIQTYNKFSISQCNSSALQNVKIWALMPFWGLKFSLCPMLATDWWMTFLYFNIQF